MNTTEKQVISEMLEEMILKAFPKAVAVSKYGGVLYTLKPDEKEGQFCGVFSYKNHVQLAIKNGPEMKDPAKLLQGTGTTRRHINFESPDAIDSKAILKLLKQAAKFR